MSVHSASGYLPMQFLSSNTNQRTDAYGGHVNNRIKFVLDTLDAMSKAAGSASKVGIKISPAMPFNDIHDADPTETYTTLVKAIGSKGLAYLHIMQSAPDPNYIAMLRPLFKGPFAAGGGFTKESGDALLKAGGADFIVYGKMFRGESRSAGALPEGRGAQRGRPEHVLRRRRKRLHRLQVAVVTSAKSLCDPVQGRARLPCTIAL